MTSSLRVASATVMSLACFQAQDFIHGFQPSLKTLHPTAIQIPSTSPHDPSTTALHVASVMRSSSSKVPEKLSKDDSSIDAAISDLDAGMIMATTSTTRTTNTSSSKKNPSRLSTRRTNNHEAALSNDGLLGNMHSILDDGQGHINAELARAIWEWENALRLEDEYPTTAIPSTRPKAQQYPASQLKFSTRQGLRLIHEIALEVLHLDHDPEEGDTDTAQPPPNYADLVQEGVVALMSAMAQADVVRIPPQEEDHTSLFEVQARDAIRNVMVKANQTTRSPRALPSVVFEALNHQDQRRSSSSSSRSSSSRTTTTTTPNAEEEVVLLPMEQEEEENTTTQSLNTALVQPLASLLQQSNPTPDEVALSDMIRHDLDGFLKRTLTPKELAVIRLKFGLELEENGEGVDGAVVTEETSCGRGWNVETIGEVMELTREQVVELETNALEKLKACFRQDYIGAYLDDDPTEEVSL